VRQGGTASLATPRWRRSRQAGFTLLESLVTIAIVGLLMVLLSQGVRFGLSSWGLRLHDDDRASKLEAVDHVLRELISRMDPGGTPGNPAPIAGAANNLRFTAKLPEGAQGLTPIRRAYILIAVDSSKRLTLSFQPYLPSPIGPTVPERRSILLEGVESVQFAYWQPTDAHQSGAWLATWNASDPPGLVRLRVILADMPGMPRSAPWPDIIVAPMRARWIF
jgi:general secretion pathway protein J